SYPYKNETCPVADPGCGNYEHDAVSFDAYPEGAAPVQPRISAFFDEATATISYLVSDPATGNAAIIDSVLDFDPASGRSATVSAERILAQAREENLTIAWILETHTHADHLSAAKHIKSRTGAPIAISEHVVDVQKRLYGIFNAKDVREGAPFDRLL